MALQKIYVDQLKKDGNYYCSELRKAKESIATLNSNLKNSEDRISYLEEDCESAYIRKEAMKQNMTQQY